MSTAAAHVSIRHHVATITLDDTARLNAMTTELGEAFAEAVLKVKQDDAVRAVVITGAGKAFSAGGDLRMLEKLRTTAFDDARQFMLDFYARFLSVTEIPVPTIAAVHGAAVGAGLCVALACDLCIVDESAKLGLNFVQLGIHPGMGASYLAPLRAGAARGAELLFTGRRFDGREAAASGLALRAVPADQVLPQAIALAEQIAAGAPLAVRATKQTIGVDRDALRKVLEREAYAQAETFRSADLGEGIAAAAGKRAPVFKGE